MLLSNRGGVPKVAGDCGGPMVTSNMGNGTKFKLSSVLPNVFSKIKGIRKSSTVQKLTSSSSVVSECASIDIHQKDFSMMSRDSHGERGPPSPVRTFPQNRNGDARYSSSPVLGQKAAQDIRLPTESPIRSKGSNKSGPFSPSPRITSSAEMVDPGCCSYDSTMALVPHDGRVRRVAPQAFGRCLLISKCNSFNGSTHSDSEISETDSSRAQTGIRHSRAMSVQLERNSCEGYGLLTTAADERPRQGSGKLSGRQRSRERRDQNVKIVEKSQQLYGGSSPIQSVRSVNGTSKSVAKCCRADHTRDRSNCRGSTFVNSSSEGTEIDHGQTKSRRHCRLSRKLSFTTDDNARPVNDTSVASEDDFYKVVTSNGKVTRGHYRSRSTSGNNNSQLPLYGGNQDTDPGYTSSEVVYTEDDRNHAAAVLRREREASLAKTVLNASDGWAEVQLSRFSHDEKPTRRASYDGADHTRKGDSEAAPYSREATLVKTVLNAQGWARENLRALAKANELDRQSLARLKAGSLDLLARREEEADKVEYETFGLPPHSKNFFSQKSSRHPSPIGEVEKYTEGRIDYKSFSPLTNLSKSDRKVVYEEFAKPVAEYAGNLYKSGRTDKSEKEFVKPWDTEFPSFRSDSILMVGGTVSDRAMAEERAALIDCTECEAPTALTPRYLERQRQNKSRGGQQQDCRNCGKVSSRSPSPREETVSPSKKNFKLSNQSSSPRPSYPKRSSASIQEFSNGKKQPSRTPSPIQDMSGRRSTSRTPSPVQDFQQVKKSSRAPSPVQDFQQVKKLSQTPSPAWNQSPQTATKPVTAKAEAGMQRLDSVAVVKASYDPYHDFRESMVEMILENDIRTAEDLEDLLQCYLSLNSSEYHKIIVQVFSDVWGDIFEQ